MLSMPPKTTLEEQKAPLKATAQGNIELLG